jgi:hypothetical protein
VFERLRAALDGALAGGDAGGLAGMREAVIEARVAVGKMRDGVRVTEAELAHERQHLRDAERRGRLAGEIGDTETVAVAQRFVAKHGERVAVLEKKLAAQQEEALLAEREVAEMTDQLKLAERDRIAREASGHVAAARAGMGEAPGPDADLDAATSRLDRAAREAAAAEQLAALKRKMGRQP